MDRYDAAKKVDSKDTCNNLKRVMKEKGYSKSRLIQETGLSEGTIARLLKNRSVGNFHTWLTVCTVLDVELSDIIKVKEEL